MGEEGEDTGGGSYRPLLGLFLSGLAQPSVSNAALPFCAPGLPGEAGAMCTVTSSWGCRGHPGLLGWHLGYY